jgi:endonuclease YncB( thermonuclease family)
MMVHPCRYERLNIAISAGLWRAVAIALGGSLAIATTSCTTNPPTATVLIKESSPPEQPAEPSPQIANAGQLYTVTRIYDGDTVEAFKDGQVIKVRLACINAPETNQTPHGQAAQQLSSLVPGQVSLNIVDEDRYGRAVAEMYHPNGSFINHGAILLAAEQDAISGDRGV